MKVKFYHLAWLLVFTVPFSSFEALTLFISVNLSNIIVVLSLYLVLGGVLVSSSQARAKISEAFVLYPFAKKLLLLLFTLIIMIIISALAGTSLSKLNYITPLLGSLFTIIVMTAGVRTFRQVQGVITAWVLGVTTMSILSLFVRFSMLPPIAGEKFLSARSLFGYRFPVRAGMGARGAWGWWGTLLIPGFWLSIYIFKRGNKFLGSFSAIVIFINIFFLQSRSTYLGLALGGLIILLFFLRDHPSVLFWVIVLLIVLISFWLVAGPSLNLASLDYGPKSGVESRFYQVQKNFKLIQRNPILGSELNTINQTIGPLVIHNSFLFYWVTFGTIAFILFVIPFIWVLIRLLKNLFLAKEPKKYSLNLFLLASLVGVIIELSLFKEISGRAPWIIMYLSLLITMEPPKEPSPKS